MIRRTVGLCSQNTEYTCRCGDLLLMTLLSELPITAAVTYNKTFECLVFTQSF